MKNFNHILKRRIVFFIINVVLCTFFVINTINDGVISIAIEKGKYQCINVTSYVINSIAKSQMSNNINRKILKKGNDGNIELNMDIINSLACNIVGYSQLFFQSVENQNTDFEYAKLDVELDIVKGGFEYEVPLGVVLNNFLLGWLGLKVPIRYGISSQIRGEIVNSLIEYGINNALLEINLRLYIKSRVLVPIITKEEEIEFNVPLFAEVVQGKIPDYYIGTNKIGG